jgi:phosphoribosylglycinamide formyltransferase-1
MKKAPVAVLISGGGSNLQALIDACAAPEFPAEIVRVISNRDDAYGLKRAEDAGLATEVIRHKDFAGRAAFDAALHAAIIASGARYVCLAGFMRILTREFVEQWDGRMINIHPSLLPSFKGMNTHAEVLAAGVRIHGCTVHYVAAEMDSGPIIIQAAVPVMAGDTVEALAARVLKAEHRIYPLALARVIEPLSKPEIADAGQILIGF